jgi:hypothetical protein
MKLQKSLTAHPAWTLNYKDDNSDYIEKLYNLKVINTMKKTLALLILSCLNSTIGNCQLLSNPSLTIEDFEISLTNPSHLINILEKHNFKYSTVGETKVITPGIMPNPLVTDLRAFNSKKWEPKKQGEQPIVEIDMYEWEPNYAPQPEVIKTIRIMLRRDSIYADKTDEFFEKIKNKYPNKGKRYFSDNELNKSYGESFYVFTNDSKIEIRTEPEKPIYNHFYIVNFDLIK